jgi:aspartyl/asparaginyl-tRNA synthetase
MAQTAGSFVRMPYGEAIDALTRAATTAVSLPPVNGTSAAAQVASFVKPVRWEDGLATEHERHLAERIVGGPVFVHDYPAAIKPFYMLPNEDGGAALAGATAAGGGRGPTVAAFDLLVPGIVSHVRWAPRGGGDTGTDIECCIHLVAPHG